MTKERLSVMRNERQSPSEILRSVLVKYGRNPDQVYCFVEGKDSSYYDLRIRMIISNKEVQHVNCDGKTNLRDVYFKVKRNQFLVSMHGMYFFDRDFDYDIEDLDESVCYITDGYSIENYYTSGRAFQRIIQSAFFANLNHSEDDDQCISHIVDTYLCLQKQFHEETRVFNEWAWSQRHRKPSLGKISFASFDRSTIVANITLRGVVGGKRLTELNQMFAEREPVNTSDLSAAAQWFSSRDRRMANRGKQEAQFLLKMLSLLSEKASRGEAPFQRPITCSLRISGPHIVSDLSSYADTPLSLRMFLENFKKSYNEQNYASTIVA
jgi:hypothetical protein